MDEPRTVQYRVLGPLRVEDAGEPLPLGGPKQRLVLALLLVGSDRVVHAERLIDGVWEEDAPAGAAHGLQGYISELRKIVPDALTFESGGYRLHVDAARIDARRFEVLAESGRGAVATAPDIAATTLREALELWGGGAYADLRYAEALQSEIDRLEAMRVSVLEHRVEADLALGRHQRLIDELRALTREHPFQERFWGQLMLALYRSDRRAEAIAAFGRARRELAEELGVDPSAELVELLRRIEASDPELILEPTADAGAGPAPTPAVHGFELRERIAEGRGGPVYAAFQASLGREVAIRIIGPELANEASFVQRFDHMSRRVARLQHPHLVPLLDAWRDPDSAYLVTPLLRGGDLDRALAFGAWDIPAALKAVEQVGGALAYAHRAGVAHGDLDASDVLLDTEGNAFVGDLGLRAMLDIARAASGDRLGEDEDGDGDDAAVRADVAGLGLLTWRLLTGLPAGQDVAAEDIATLRPEVPSEVGPLIARSIEPPDGVPAEGVAAFLRGLRRAFGVDAVAPGIAIDDEAEIRDPYKGLRAFEESDAADFFGRDAAIELALGRLRAHRLVTVVGSSGGGKSSLVRAGVMPALRAGMLPDSSTWLTATIIPGAYPFEELAGALRAVAVADEPGVAEQLRASDDALRVLAERILPPAAELLLIVDQLEELFSMVSDADARRRFLANLVSATREPGSRVRVLATARADFFDRFLDEPVFGGPLRDGLVALAQPSAEELTLAIAAPAERAGLRLEPGLTERIVADVHGRPAALPLMQHVLTELVQRRDGNLLTLAAYEQSGGAPGALGNRAEQVYAGLDPEARLTARDVLLRLIAIDDEGGLVRRRLGANELQDLGLERMLLDEVLGGFGAFRLLTFDRDPVSRGPTVEVTHEALFTQWSRLFSWVESRHEQLLVQRRLGTAVAEWEAAEREPSYLLSAGRLLEFERWAAETDLPLRAVEGEYLAASRQQEEELAARDARRRRIGAGVLGVIVIVVTVLGASAWAAMQTADHERAVASVIGLLAESEDAAERETDLGILLAAEAVRAARSIGPELLAQAEERLHEAIAADRIALTLYGDGEVAWSPDGEKLAYYTSLLEDDEPDGILVVDPTTGELVAPFLPTLPATRPWDLGWSPDGRFLAATYEPQDDDALPLGPVIWDVGSGTQVATLTASEGVLLGPVYSPDGRLLAAADMTGTTVWRRTDEPGLPAEGPTRQAWEMAYHLPRGHLGLPEFDPLGRALTLYKVVDGVGVWVVLVEAETGDEVEALGPLEGGILDVSWSPDGRRVAALTSEEQAFILSLDVGAAPVPIALDFEGREIDWSPLGDTIAVAGEDGSVTLWDARSGAHVQTLAGHTDPVTGIEWSPTGRTLASAGEFGPVYVWEPAGVEAEIAAFDAGDATTLRVAWSDDEQWVLGHGSDGTVRLWRSSGGEPVKTLPDQSSERPFGLTVSPDGIHAAVASPEWSSMLVELETLDPVWEEPFDGRPGSFSSDGLLLSTGHVGGVYIVNVETSEDLAEFVPPEGETEFPFQSVFLDGDRWVLVIHPQQPPRLWDWHTNDMVELDYRTGDGSAAVSPDRTRFAIGGEDMTGASVWDAIDFLAGEAEAPTLIQADLPISSEAVALAFTPDGEQLVTGLRDDRATFWDMSSGEQVRVVPHVSWVSGAQVSADGKRLLVGGDARVYTLDTDELLAIADERVSR